MPTRKIAVLPGDGIGQEVIPEAIKVLRVVAKASGASFEFEEGLVGGAAIDETGGPLPDSTFRLCEASDAILFGAVGGPKWDDFPHERRPERGLLRLRKELDLFANLRPAKCFSMLVEASPLRRSVVEGTDLMVVRELTGGLYFGEPHGIERMADGSAHAVNTMSYTSREIERVARVAFDVARKRRKRLTSVDKANVLVVSQLWREVVTQVARAYPDVALEHVLVDNCAMALVARPTQFDTIVTENTFGDILSDEAAILAGSMGMLPSASLGG
ncbi:MAG: 3-isopropylmalate dehydrogenase, partial [Candidatus Rokubacteria bacterium]|nr:3-isopropylmalate dehydrogenase [Candidatus Rokubacteria bacterium]